MKQNVLRNRTNSNIWNGCSERKQKKASCQNVQSLLRIIYGLDQPVSRPASPIGDQTRPHHADKTGPANRNNSVILCRLFVSPLIILATVLFLLHTNILSPRPPDCADTERWTRDMRDASIRRPMELRPDTVILLEYIYTHTRRHTLLIECRGLYPATQCREYAGIIKQMSLA